MTAHAIGDLNGLPKEHRDQVHQDLKILPLNPFPHGTAIKRLKGFHLPVYRFRSGDYRVLYTIRGKEIIILRVINRKILEREIKRLKLHL
jgi:mRNA-degrading endonuclease RelE of RelBE toxin-antitoxin system